MEKLTAQQAKMVLEYFARQAAEDYPVAQRHEQDKHMWMTRYQASLAIERQITELDWVTLLNATRDLQSFDRDPAGYLNEQGILDTETHRDWELIYVTDQVSWQLDNCYNNSGA